MLALHELQTAFAAHLAGEDRADLAAVVEAGEIPVTGRLGVYRNHVLESLGAALAASFPTVHAVVGRDFFRRLARDFIRQFMPTQPVLAEYGAGLPAFIATYEPANGLPYLSDVARLDWALNVAMQAPAGPRLAPADLAAVPEERLPCLALALADGAAVLSSPYPLDAIWQVSQPGAVETTVDLDSGFCHVLVLRRPENSMFVRLSVGEAAFLSRVNEGRVLEDAAGAAFQADAGFDLTTSFARLLALGTFAAPR